MKRTVVVCMSSAFCIIAVAMFLSGATTGLTDGRALEWLATHGELVDLDYGGRPSSGGILPAWVQNAKISPALQAALAEQGETTFLVVLHQQADLGDAAALPTKAAKGRVVYESLRTVARRTQASLRAELDALGVAYRPFYIVNMLAVRGDGALAQSLGARPDVARLEANPSVRFRLPENVERRERTLLETTGIEWGVRRIRADEVWAMGYNGQGVVVAGQDTGYEWDHPALKAQYRGWDGASVDHDYNWHDAIHENDPHTLPGNPCGFDASAPCDDHSHGTHTMGTIVGDDGGYNQIGVAPGAQWIGCRNMEQGWGTPATYAECFEFFLAPYPIGGDPMTDGNPDLAPHLINNSWACPPSEGCDIASLRTIVENVRAAGIAVVVSAGNSGSGCGTVSTPPAIYEASFTIGATTSGDQIAGFSSRGPVVVDSSNRPKPDVSAPGVNVRSSVPGGEYGFKSGTSMAAPHVSGLVALLWSAVPQLIGDVDLTETLVQKTARPIIDGSCGGEDDGHPNNVYGWGIVDAVAAVHGATPGLDILLDVEPTWVQAGGLLTYTFAVTNTSAQSQATGVTLSDTVPLSTTFARATGIFSRTDDAVIWSLGTVSPSQQAYVALVVEVNGSATGGTFIANADYSVRSDQVLTPVRGSPRLALVPWQWFFTMIRRSWP